MQLAATARDGGAVQGEREAKLVVLILGDFDPDGDAIVNAFLKSMRDDFSVRALEPVHAVLDVCADANAPSAAGNGGEEREAANYKRFVAKHGTDTYELEAVPPEQAATASPRRRSIASWT